MINRNYIAILFVSMLVLSTLAAMTQTGSKAGVPHFESVAHLAQLRRHINLDEDWRFHFGHAADPAKDFNYSISTIFSKSGGAAGTAIDARFKDSGWRKLDLPHDWVVEL